MLSLVADYSGTSSSSEDEDSEEEPASVEKSTTKVGFVTYHGNNSKPLLPSASALLNSTTKGTGVVFSNPFLDAEKAEIDKLQKHVKMVESEEHLMQKNGRKICWNNRKGRCRFGNKCKYAHDSDLVAGGGDNETEAASEETQLQQSPNTTPANVIISKSAQLGQAHEAPEGKTKSRKRPGLGDALVPGKKVIKQYQATKDL
ncbi:uncharacterized protein LOC133323763 [Musca vetustissima]|uniref:uncharacterized protein LOC133323763 n=1 Tax=Musca vetustissima TaxID=27455 RepID=UPI002AB715E1|nr:uncharacterized protein LOC133323763 [Musca vetustissima]